MRFDLIRPCALCPFRHDIRAYLTPGRADEIAHSLMAGNAFPCHKTTIHDDDGEYVPTSDEQHCAGALIVMERMEYSYGQLARIAMRLGMFDPNHLDMASPVYDDFAEWIDAQPNRDLRNAHTKDGAKER